MTTQTTLDSKPVDTTDALADDCDDCAALPDGWVCADCYIKGDAELPAAGEGEA